MKKPTKFKKPTLRFISLIIYIICVIVLVVEASMDGHSSSSQSNAVGGTIAGIINDFKGDQTVATKPTKLTIDNKITTGYVGDTYLLQTTVLPKESTFKEVEYKSSDLSVASVDGNGLVTFIAKGEVTITASNANYDNIKDQVTISVLEVDIESVEHHINAEKNADGIYVLYADIYDYDASFESYYISTTVNPNNATWQDISYSLSSKTYLEIDEKGQITPLKYSNNAVTTIKVTVGNVETELKVIVDLKSIVHVSEVNITTTSYTIIKTQQLSLSVDVKPSNATFKGYTLKSANSAVAKITNNKIVGTGVGITSITLTMNNYPTLTKTIEVEVKTQPMVTGFATQTTLNITEGRTAKISISKVTPNYADTSSVTYSSSNPSVATVKNGVISALVPGNCDITTTINGISKITNITVNPKTDFVDKLELSENIDNVLFVGKEHDLSKVLDITNIKYYKENTLTTVIHKQFSYTLVGEENVASISGNKLTAIGLGEVKITLTHDSSGASIDIDLIIIDDYQVSAIQNAIETPLSKEEAVLFNLNVNELLTYNIKDNEYDQKYEIIETIGTNTIINEETNKIMASSNGTSTINISPVVESENEQLISLVKQQYSYSLELDITHIYNQNSNVKINVTNEDTNETIIIKNNELKMYVNEKISVQAKKDSSATISGLNFSSSNEKVLKVDNQGNLLPQGVGSADLILKDEFSSNVNQVIHISIYNKILIDSQNAISVSGHDAKYDKDKNLYSIVNGYSGKIKLNFLKESTFNKVVYSSSNEKILKVGQDGTLTPYKVGTATITLVVDDGMQDSHKIEVTIKVMPQKVIENLSVFFRKIRKMIGHFGAFLVLGIFSTLTYLLYFKNKKWFFSVPLNFVQGFLVAALTEYIQTFVPGRSGAWSDVVLDTSGFMLSAVLFTVIILGVYLIKYLKVKKQNKILVEGSEVLNEEKEN